MKIGLLALVAIVVLFAGCTSTPAAPQEHQADFAKLALIVTVLVFLFGTIGYMISVGFGLRDLNIWSKNVLYDTMTTVLMIAFFFLFIGFLNFMLPQFVNEPASYGPGSACATLSAAHIRVACDYAERVRGKLVFDALDLTSLNGFLGYLQTYTLFIRPLGVGFLIKPFGALRVFTDVMGVALNAMSLVIVEMYAHVLLLQFIDDRMLLLFLPLGLVFRSLLDEPIGGIFIAMAIGLYVVYPFTLILDDAIVMHHYNDNPNWASTETLADAGYTGIVALLVVLFLPASGIAGSLWSAGASRLVAIGFLSKLSPFITLAGTLFVLPSIAQPILTGMVELMWYYAVPEIIYTVIVVGIVLPIVNILITLTFIRELAKIMGAEINISSLTKLI